MRIVGFQELSFEQIEKGYTSLFSAFKFNFHSWLQVTTEFTTDWAAASGSSTKGYGFLSFARKFGDKSGKKLMDTATKIGVDAAKTASKRVVQNCKSNRRLDWK